MNWPFAVLSIAVFACLVPPALGSKVLTAQTLAKASKKTIGEDALSLISLKGAAKLAIKTAMSAGTALLEGRPLKTIADSKIKLVSDYHVPPVPTPSTIRYQYSYPLYHVRKLADIPGLRPVVRPLKKGGGPVIRAFHFMKSALLRKFGHAEHLAYDVKSDRHKNFRTIISNNQNND